jgi:uncharacterized RDD family membrane protein YckC
LSGDGRNFLNTFIPAINSAAALFAPLRLNPTFSILFLIELLSLLTLKAGLEGRYGITIGKWMAGIRTVRTTLRPCGFARSLARNVLYAVDFPLALTPLPGLISILLSQHHQRLGDRVADTIVVLTKSVGALSSGSENDSES